MNIWVISNHLLLQANLVTLMLINAFLNSSLVYGMGMGMYVWVIDNKGRINISHFQAWTLKLFCATLLCPLLL